MVWGGGCQGNYDQMTKKNTVRKIHSLTVSKGQPLNRILTAR